MMFLECTRTPQVLNYKIVRGKPAQVEMEVQSLVSSGYTLNGPLFKMDEAGTTILVQGLVLLDD